MFLMLTLGTAWRGIPRPNDTGLDSPGAGYGRGSAFLRLYSGMRTAGRRRKPARAWSRRRWDEVGWPAGSPPGPAGGWTSPRLALTDRELCETQKKWESADKPGSVVDNHPSGARVAASLKRPTRKLLRAAGAGPKARVFPYLVLLQVGFAVPPNVATGAVRSYRTLSPLPSPHCCSAWAVCSLLHFPWARAPQALPGTLPCGARTFLCSDAAIAWPTPAPIIPAPAAAMRADRVPCARAR